MATDLENGQPWHALPGIEVAGRLDSDLDRGLASAEAGRRQERFGPNIVQGLAQRGVLAMLAGQFNDFMILVLLAAALVSGFVGDIKDTLTILVIVLLNAAIGFVQEYRAARTMAALKRLAAARAQVVRDGQRSEVAADQLVPGDLVVLEAGNLVPADLRLVEAVGLKLDESMLTGEAAGVDKSDAPLADPETALGDRRNMAYKGTLVRAGRGHGLVVATGMATELGAIAALLHQTGETRTPLQLRLAAFGRRIGIAILALCALLFAVGLLRGEPPVLMFLTAVSLAVAAIPEALPAVVTISLAIGAGRMVRQQALIRRLPAVESLGSVTYICTDKTGTLTQNRMRVETLWNAGTTVVPEKAGAEWRDLFVVLALCNDSRRGQDGRLLGEATEVALLEAALAAGIDRPALERDCPRTDELAFDSERKRMTTLHRLNDGSLACCKGAPEAVLHLCERGRGAFEPQAVLDQAERMAAAGMRVLAVAQRRWPQPRLLEEIETGLEFLGLVGLIDPPRPEARESVEQCRNAGIAVVMITGDHPATALAIARRLGIAGPDDSALVGSELAGMDDGQLATCLAHQRVFARIDPAQKIRIVTALQANGEFAAMTGDGVNDAPALAAAHIGVAMGKGGTDVAREAAGLVLLDDNFATIVAAVREGRRIYDNIRKFIKYVMTSNAGEMWTLILAPFLGLPIPLLPIQILWINLVTDGLPGLALAVEPEEHGLMRRPPRPPGESVFAHGMWQHIAWVGVVMAAVSLFTQAWALHSGSAHWQSMVFTVLTLSQLGQALAIRSEHTSFFRLGPASNWALSGTVVLTVCLQLATLYVPALNVIFGTAPLSGGELVLCLLLSSVVFWVVETKKWLVRRGLS